MIHTLKLKLKNENYTIYGKYKKHIFRDPTGLLYNPTDRNQSQNVLNRVGISPNKKASREKIMFCNLVASFDRTSRSIDQG